jgi:hypothetical protein
MSINIQYNLSETKDIPVPIAFFRPSGGTDLKEGRRIFLFAGYNNTSALESTNQVKIGEVVMGEIKGTSKKMRTVKNINAKPVTFPKNYPVFCGIVERPSINGDRNGVMSISIYATESLKLTFPDPKSTMRITDPSSSTDNSGAFKVALGGADINRRTNISVKSALDICLNKLKDSIQESGNSSYQTFIQTVTFDTEDISNDTGRLGINPGVADTLNKPYNNGGVYEYVQFICKTLGVDFFQSFDLELNKEVIKFVPKGLYKSIPKTIMPEGTGDTEYALIVRYGEAVLDFSWSGTTIGGLSVGPKGITTDGSGRTVIQTSGDYEGYVVEYTIDQNKIRDYVKATGEADTTNQSFIATAKAKEWAERNASEFIANFVNLAEVQSDPRRTPPPPGYGINGITLNLTMRYAIPGMRPGTLIFFGPPNLEDASYGNFPFYLVGVYRVKKVTDNFSGRDDIWQQTLECER